MAWINIKTIPSGLRFLNIISGLVINCPSCEKKVINEKRKIKRKIIFKPISVHDSTFRSRGISGNMFVTLLASVMIKYVEL